jgi:hypothetical protein
MAKQSKIIRKIDQGWRSIKNGLLPVGKGPQRSGTLRQVLDYGRTKRRPCRYALVGWFEGDKRRNLGSCHKTLTSARAAIKKTRKASKGKGLKFSIYSLSTRKRVPSTKPKTK